MWAVCRIRASSQQSTPSIGSSACSFCAAATSASASSVVSSTVQASMYSFSQVGSACRNMWIRYCGAIERRMYSRNKRIPVATTSRCGLVVISGLPDRSGDLLDVG